MPGPVRTSSVCGSAGSPPSVTVSSCEPWQVDRGERMSTDEQGRLPERAGAEDGPGEEPALASRSAGGDPPRPGHGRPLISFLTTAYRTEGYLAEMIDSVAAQASADWELIVVDNGLSDAVAEVVRPSLQDDRVHLIRQENRGYRGGVMAAAAAAAGRYVCVLDSDDKVSPDFVATMARFIEEHPEVDAVGCDAAHYDEKSQVHLTTGHLDSLGVRWQPRFSQEKLTVADLLAGVVPYYTAAVRREAWDAVGGYAEVDLGADQSQKALQGDHVTDVQMWIRLVRSHDVRILGERLGWCRIRAESLSRDEDKVESFESALIATLAQAAEGADLSAEDVAANPLIRRVRFHQSLRRARTALLDKEVEVARHHAREAYRLQPGVRAAAVVVALAVAPGTLRRLHPYKQVVTTRWRRVRELRARAYQETTPPRS